MSSKNLKQLEARQLQSKKAKEDNTEDFKYQWGDLDALYNDLATSIVDVGTKINESIRLLQASGKELDTELINTVNGIRKDLIEFTNELLDIKSSHEGNTGKIKDEDELVLCLEVFNNYVILSDRFRAIIFQPMLTITEHLYDIATPPKPIESETVIETSTEIIKDA